VARIMMRDKDDKLEDDGCSAQEHTLRSHQQLDRLLSHSVEHLPIARYSPITLFTCML
jgi:hypothetical protein